MQRHGQLVRKRKTIGPSQGASEGKIESLHKRISHLSGIAKVSRKQMIEREEEKLQLIGKY